ncbi:MAG: (d)CMP kinase [Phycisphaeraceae bacterium]|nr:MAG: (d)CMP kinase [Phycisphaeraceae bacterium]
MTTAPGPILIIESTARGDDMKTLLAGRPVIITLDGPAGTGKSSVARSLAKRLGLDFLDTGAMYRAAAVAAMRRGLRPDQAAEVVAAAIEADIHFDWSKDPPSIVVDRTPVDDLIRRPEVTSVVSPIAAIGDLRRLMVSRQREIAKNHRRLVSEGRDQGSVVFPSADVKFYLEADAAVRARRRADQLLTMNQPADSDRIRRDIEERDQRDSTRADGPLICPPDAVRIDTSSLSFERVVDRLEDEVRTRLVR